MDSTEEQLAQMAKEFQSRSKATVVLETALFALLVLVLFVGNSITLFVIAFNSRMRTIPNMLVASLAVSDFLTGALSASSIAPMTLATSQWPFDNTTCQYQGYIAVFLAVASVHTLALMAVNRYFKIVRPAKYRRYFTRKRTTIMIAALWFYCLWAPLPYLLSGHKMVFHPFKFFCYLQIDSGPFTAFLVTVYVGLPTCAIFFCYLRIFQTVRSHNNNFHATGGTSNAVNVEEIKIARTLFVIVVFFNLCWTPILIVDTVDTIRGRWVFPRGVYVTYSFLGLASSALNPVLYGILNKNFQNEYLKILRCGYCRSKTTPLTTVEPFILTERGAKSVATTVA